MKNLFFLGFAVALSFNACQKQENYYDEQLPEIDKYATVNDASLMKQKFNKELGFLDFPKIISDLTELKVHRKNIAKK